MSLKSRFYGENLVREVRKIKTFIKRLALLISVIIIWDMCSKNMNPLFVPAPKVVFTDLIEMIKTGQLVMAIKYSFLRITIATFISASIAFPIPYPNGLFIAANPTYFHIPKRPDVPLSALSPIDNNLVKI